MENLKALERAVARIENNLDSVTVSDVACAAGYSYYHLNRLFSYALGESVGNYIKKRRLASGTKMLTNTTKRVIDIAIECGFESSEAFSRAFKSVYQVSPIQYRKNGLDAILGAKKQLDCEMLHHLAGNVTVHPTIVEIEEIKIIGVRGKSTLQNNIIPKIWQRFCEVEAEIPHTFPSSRKFGICESNETVFTMTENKYMTITVGIEVTNLNGIPDNLIAKTIPGGRYAAFTHTGTLRNIRKTFDYIWGTWTLSSKQDLDNRENFEVYDERYIGFDHPHTQIDIYIPIK